MKKLIIIFILIIIGLILSWYFDIWHKSDESINELIGQNYDYACKIYFRSEPDSFYEVNINHKLNEFDGGILNKKSVLTDSIVRVFTWNFCAFKKTIWVGKTKRMKNEIVDAIRY
ncbi:MAG: hypothetical protein WCH34_08775, partial [Bacteroidota bacterium]